MKILKRKEFLALPVGTLYMRYRPCMFDNLCLKYQSWENDFVYQNLTSEIESNGSDELMDLLDRAENDSSLSLKLDLNCSSREGLYDDNLLYAVYEQADIDVLIEKLKECKGI